ncbi:MAG: hypothetical protein CL670_08095 [Balneola sp.]|jgi:hypothetical protein|nr:hypothetical protein [Balneola sp.]MBE79098.1 hypothetical protein [Balneola sp.]HBX64948.1 hypothetical protein [Balneolaceae bacterium]|tara:strand:+ start:799 stop:1326 length:528 start_codon:yes stop_codon:yes gene_type:complete
MKLIGVCITITLFLGAEFYNNSKDQKKTEIGNLKLNTDTTSSWLGEWNFETITNEGKIVMTIKLVEDGSGFRGWHCMTDGRILGGASDCADLTGNTPQYTLKNSTQIESTILEFDFTSGYIPRNGKARLIKVDDRTIRFIITDPPPQFKLSPLANYLLLNEGLGTDALGGVILTK